MAKFCVYCGKPLQEGELCACTNVQAPPPIQPGQQQWQQQTKQPDKGPNPYKEKFDLFTKHSGNYLKQLFAQFKAILTQPATNGHSFLASADYKKAIGFVAVQAILSALFAAVFYQKAGSLLYVTFGNIGGITGYMLGLLKVTFLTLILTLALSAILSGILLGAAKLAKSTATYYEMLCLVGMKCIMTAPIVLVSMILLYVNVSFGIAIYVLSVIFGFLVIAMYFNHAATINPNRVLWIVAGAMAVFFLAYYVLFHLTAWLYLPMGYTDYFGARMTLIDYLNVLLSLL